MLSRLSRLFELLESFGGLSSIWQVMDLVPAVWEQLKLLAEADSAKDYHDIAIGILRPIATRTTTTLDDGLLTALSALAKDPDWIEWVDALIAGTPAHDLAPLAPGSDIPEGALSLPHNPYHLNAVTDVPLFTRSHSLDSPFDPASLPAPLVAQNFASLPTILQWLPAILQLIEELKRLRDLFRPEPILA